MWGELLGVILGGPVKRAGRHPQNALTAVAVRAQKAPGRYADGNGLYLVVDESGAKRWLLRTMVQGRRRDIGLGGLSWVSLAEARERAATYRKIAREGGDPLAAREAAKPVTLTFEEAAERVHASQKPGWKNAKHGDQWISTLRTYAYPHIGRMPVDRITTPHILKVLEPIWLEKGETAGRIRQRIRTVLDWARTAGYRSGENPVDGVERGLPRQTKKVEHHKAVPYVEVGAFVQRLRVSDLNPSTKLAFEFLTLTATRTSEVLLARWDEVDQKAALWVIPADRMKAGVEHRVPISSRARKLLQAARQLSEGEFVFPGMKAGKPLSNMAFTMAMRRMEVAGVPHGFRSSFRDWASEATSFPHEVAEMALAHTIKNKVEAAYRRGDLIEKRREMMEAWAAYLDPDSGS